MTSWRRDKELISSTMTSKQDSYLICNLSQNAKRGNLAARCCWKRAQATKSLHCLHTWRRAVRYQRNLLRKTGPKENGVMTDITETVSEVQLPERQNEHTKTEMHDNQQQTTSHKTSARSGRQVKVPKRYMDWMNMDTCLKCSNTMRLFWKCIRI